MRLAQRRMRFQKTSEELQYNGIGDIWITQAKRKGLGSNSRNENKG